MEEKILATDLLTEMKTALSDEFVAQIDREENSLVLRFANGQNFRVTLTEEK